MVFKNISISRIFLTINLFLIVFSAAFIMLNFTVNNDTGWLIYAAREVIENGKVLYRDLAETNPPLIMYFNYLAVLLSPAEKYDFLSYKILVLALIATSFLLSARMLSPMQADKKNVIFIGISTALIFIPGNNAVFGQREHIFIICLLPYIMYSIPTIYSKRKEKKIDSIAITFFLAIGLFMKPFFLMVYLALEFFYLAKKRKIAKDRALILFLLLALGILYLLAAYIFNREYFTEILPLLKATYFDHRLPTSDIIKGAAWHIMPLLTILFLIYSDHDGEIKEDATFILILVVACGLIIFLQFKGWHYTYYPLQASIALFLSFVITNLNKSHIIASNIYEKIFCILLCVSFFVFCQIGIDIFTGTETLQKNIGMYALPLFFLLFFTSETYNRLIERKNNIKQTFKIIAMFIFFIFVLRGYIDSLSIIYFAKPFYISSMLAIVAITYLLIMLQRRKCDKQIQGQTLSHFKKIMLVVILVVYFVKFFNGVVTYRGDDTIPVVSKLVDNIKYHNAETVYIFNTGLYPAFPAVNFAGVKWAARYHHLWMVAGIFKDSNNCTPIKGTEKVLETFKTNLLNDLYTNQPDMIIVDSSPKIFFGDKGYFELDKCLLSEKFKKLMQLYREEKSIDICNSFFHKSSCFYRVFNKKVKLH